MKDSDDSTGIESIDISRDIMPVLINMPFNYILNKTRNESNEITFELKPRKNKVNNKLRYLFEFTFGLLRTDQLKKLDSIIKSIEGQTLKPFDLYQLIMAAGKTDVLTPYLGMYYALQNRIFIDVTLGTLIKTTLGAFLNKSALLFNINIFEIQIKPSEDNNTNNINLNNYMPFSNCLINSNNSKKVRESFDPFAKSN